MNFMHGAAFWRISGGLNVKIRKGKEEKRQEDGIFSDYTKSMTGEEFYLQDRVRAWYKRAKNFARIYVCVRALLCSPEYFTTPRTTQIRKVKCRYANISK